MFKKNVISCFSTQIAIGQSVRAYVQTSDGKNWVAHVLPAKITRGYRKRDVSIGYLLLSIKVQSSQGPILYRFQDIVRYWPKT